MSSEVDWVLAQLQSVVDASAEPLKRVNRDESEILEGSIQSRTGELKDANFVGATLADVSTEPIGTEYDHAREAVVGVRIEGLDHSEWGHIDPAGNDGVPFTGDGSLVNDIKTAVLEQRTWPDAGGANVEYTNLTIANQAPQSSSWEDYYRYDVDIIFDGFETLP